MRILPLALLASLAIPLRAQTPGNQKKILSEIRFDQNLNAQVPLNLAFRDDTGKPVRLSDYFGKRPVILSLVYFQCPMLCTESLNGLVRAIRSLSFDLGKQFNIVTVSFDPRETPALAAAKRRNYVERYGRPGEDWNFLTGDEASIHALTDAVGFHYAYDSEIQQYGHPTGIVVLTPEGRISHYLFGVEYSAKDLRLALTNAGEGKIGSPVDRLLLYCYHYDPTSGKYNLAVMRVLQVAGVLTLAAVGVLLKWGRKA